MSAFQVLVVDDSAVHLKLLEHTLSGEFDTVHQARNGREAMEIFERERPEFVITDCVMPDLTGFELCERVRAAQSSHTYIIMVTSIAEKGNIVKGCPSRAADKTWARHGSASSPSSAHQVWTEPAFMCMTRSAKTAASSRSCVTKTLVTPSERCSAASSCRRCARSSGSRLASGSSNRISRG